jgi:hypothetical protein
MQLQPGLWWLVALDRQRRLVASYSRFARPERPELMQTKESLL